MKVRIAIGGLRRWSNMARRIDMLRRMLEDLKTAKSIINNMLRAVRKCSLEADWHDRLSSAADHIEAVIIGVHGKIVEYDFLNEEVKE